MTVSPVRGPNNSVWYVVRNLNGGIVRTFTSREALEVWQERGCP